MQVIVKKAMVDSLVSKLVKEERSFHSRNVSELEKASPPIFPQPQMAQQLSTSKMPVEDNEFVPTNTDELGKATMQLSHKVDDELIEKFYNNFKTLVKKFEAMNEARRPLPSLLGEPEKEPKPKGAAARRAARLKDAEPEQVFIPSTPAEDAADITASINRPKPQMVASDDAKKARKSAKKSAKSDPSDPGLQYDPVAEYLKSLYQPRERPEWMKNVTMNLSDMVVGDANKLLAAIVKQVGEENITESGLEDAAQDAINNLTYAIDGNDIVITSPAYKVKFKYNTEGNPANLFSLEQYQETLRDLTSQKSAGVGSQESWGPKYEKAIKQLTRAKSDQELKDILLNSLPEMQEALTDAVLDSYPPGTEEFNTKEVADKLEIINGDVVDAFMKKTFRSGTNTVTVDVLGKPVQVSLEIPTRPNENTENAIEDVAFGNVLLDLLNATPDELRAYVGKKRRSLRSAIKMSRTEENYFYDLGMKIGGKNFKMSAAEFRERLQNALDARDEGSLDLSNEEIVNLILTRADIIDKNQVEIIANVQDYAYKLFENYMQKNPALVKKFGIDKLLQVIPEDLGKLPADLRDVFDKFFKEIIMVYTSKKVVTPFFKSYDAIVDDPATKAHFKETAGVKHSQIYDQPGAGRRAKDITNFVGNLRHISQMMKIIEKSVRKEGDKKLADKLASNAESLVSPNDVAESFKLFFKKLDDHPVKAEIDKVVNKTANDILKIDLNSLPTPESDEDRANRLAAMKAAERSRRSREAELVSASPAPEITTTQPGTPADPAEIIKTYDDIIATYNTASDAVKEKMFDDFEDTVLAGEIKPLQFQKYPALKSVADYETLVDKLEQLNESSVRSLLLNLIHGYTRG